MAIKIELNEKDIKYLKNLEYLYFDYNDSEELKKSMLIQLNFLNNIHKINKK